MCKIFKLTQIHGFWSLNDFFMVGLKAIHQKCAVYCTRLNALNAWGWMRERKTFVLLIYVHAVWHRIRLKHMAAIAHVGNTQAGVMSWLSTSIWCDCSLIFSLCAKALWAVKCLFSDRPALVITTSSKVLRYASACVIQPAAQRLTSHWGTRYKAVQNSHSSCLVRYKNQHIPDHLYSEPTYH